MISTSRNFLCIALYIASQLQLSEAYSMMHETPTAFLGKGTGTRGGRSPRTQRQYRLDADDEEGLRLKKKVLEQLHHTKDLVGDIEAKYGMPWKESIDPTYQNGGEGLFYMDFWEWQMNFMKENLTNLRVLPTTSRDGLKDLTYKEDDKKTVRMITLCFASDEYRKIRMTVYDAGNRTQVFTSLWYPQPEYNLPVLGIDLLQFNRNRHLCVVDFQPIQDKEQEHDQSYEDKLRPIREQFPSLQGKMTKRFYDENQFFSKQMLFGRFDEEEDKKVIQTKGPQHPVFRDLMPAYQQYVRSHVSMVQSTQPKLENVPGVLNRHMNYDNYSSKRDPAHGMFIKTFGKEFADDFVYDVLFTFSQRDEEEA